MTNRRYVLVAIVVAAIIAAVCLKLWPEYPHAKHCPLETDYIVQTYKISHDDACDIAKAVHSNAEAKDLDAALVYGIIAQESSFRLHAKSRVASGLMQIHVIHRVADVHEIDVNIDAGTDILRAYLDKHNGNVKAALKKYSGNAKHYYEKVMTKREPFHRLIRE